jgi:putative SOS response-associated peptidase YedK
MCGRFTLTKDTSDIAKRWRIGNIEVEAKPRYNIAPTQSVLIVTDEGERKLEQMRWGLIPSWAEDPAVGNKMINARAETVAEKPSFKNALKKRRCLVLADGFYEWQKLGAVKQPVHIVLKNREPFGFAGL